MIVSIGISALFLLFLGVMILGNHLSHSFAQILNKQADQELAELNQYLDQVTKPDVKNKK